MIRLQTMPEGSCTAIARAYANPNAGPLEDYHLLYMLNWKEGSDEVWIHGMKGNASMKDLRDLVAKLDELGFRYIRALRAEGKILPRAKPHPDGNGLVIDIWEFLQVPPVKGDSQFTPL